MTRRSVAAWLESARRVIARNWTNNHFPTPTPTDGLNGRSVACWVERVPLPAGAAWTNDHYLTGQVGAHAIAQYRFPEGGSVRYGCANVELGDGFGNTTTVSSTGQSDAFALTGVSMRLRQRIGRRLRQLSRRRP